MPGETGVWILIAGDVLVFSLLFVTYLSGRIQNRSQYSLSQLDLSGVCGAINTLLMLFSSWFVAMATRSARLKRSKETRHFFGMAIACGLGFTLVKYVEYSTKLHAGITPATNDFFMFYYVMTGIHLFHVFIGMGVLLVLCRYSLIAPGDVNMIRNVESGASFWHAVDVVWIVIFALLYLVR
jgi:nitric oxide reductase NorE protein